MDASFCVLMARYNQWMNERLYAVCLEMSDAERKLDRGAFFGSIHTSLNHILYGDTSFMARFRGEPTNVPPIGEDLYADFDALAEARRDMDAAILDWAGSLSNAWLQQDLTYKSAVDGKTRTRANWVLVTHMFNHQTHHRGQVTTLLSQMGLDMGSTDIPFMPDA